MNIELKYYDNLTLEEKNTLCAIVDKANKKSKVFKLKKNQNYYFITTEGKVDREIWEDVEWDNDLFNLGNCFETQEEAEFALEKQKVYTQLKRYALEHNDGEIDWDNEEQLKCCITKDFDKLIFRFFYHLQCPNQIYFTSAEIAQNAIAEIGEDRIKKYLFEVM